MKYRPGSQLKEIPLAEEFGISRGQIRKVIARLSNEQLVETHQYKGAFVTSLSEKVIEELFDIREMLEIKASKLAIRHSTREELEGIRNALDRRERILFKNKFTKYYIPKIDFHNELFKLSKNNTLISLWEGIHPRLKLIRIQSAMHGERYLESLKEHKKILLSIYENHPKAAEDLISAHIQKARNSAMNSIRASES